MQMVNSEMWERDLMSWVARKREREKSKEPFTSSSDFKTDLLLPPSFSSSPVLFRWVCIAKAKEVTAYSGKKDDAGWEERGPFIWALVQFLLEFSCHRIQGRPSVPCVTPSKPRVNLFTGVPLPCLAIVLFTCLLTQRTQLSQLRVKREKECLTRSTLNMNLALFEHTYLLISILTFITADRLWSSRVTLPVTHVPLSNAKYKEWERERGTK